MGDILVGDSAICTGFGFRTRYAATGLERVFSAVRPALAGADVVFGNLESTLSTAGLRARNWRSAQMRGDPTFAADLKHAGFAVLNVANNHAMQHGAEALRDTVRLLETNGIRTCGLRGSAHWASEPVTLTAPSGGRVGILGYCMRPRQFGETDTLIAEGNPPAMHADVRRLADEVDHVLVSLHWGEEFVNRPSRSEVALARSLVDAGAAVIMGHHPHVVRPVERYSNGVIAYSLGNFVADMLWQPVLRQGALLRCELDGRTVERVEVLRTAINDHYQPVVAGPDDGGILSDVPIEGLDEPTYRREERRTVRAQRTAAYRYAASNVLRYPPGMLAQLVGVTLRNKVIGLLRGGEG